MEYLNHRKERRRLTRAIQKLVHPHLWRSGYVGANGPLKVWFPRDRKGAVVSDKQFKLRGAFVLRKFDGFVEDGVALDGYAGGLSTAGYESFPIEDLARLHKWAVQRFGSASAQPR